MSFKNPKNLIIVVSVVAALMAGTVLLGGYANLNTADNEAPAKGCQASGDTGCCPSMANPAAFSQVTRDVQTESGCYGKPGKTGCPKPCCAEDGPKGCCGTAGATGCPMTAAKTAAE